jgi:hypothetical protein
VCRDSGLVGRDEPSQNPNVCQLAGYVLVQVGGFQLGFKDSKPKLLLSLLDMLKAYALGFYKVAIDLQELRVYASLRSGETKISSFTQANFEKLLASMKEECRNLELSHTLKMALGIESKYRTKIEGKADRILGECYTDSDLLSDLDTLDMSFSNELGGELIFRIASGRNGYFEKDDLFGPEVTSAFPSSIDNIRNAGTCFAVEQYDACVFHLMRVLEHGIRVLATKFNVPFQNTTWHTIIQQIEASVRGMNSSFGADWKEQQKFCSEAASQFMFLKDAWRNHIMHLSDVYDEGKALSVFRHSHELMRTLAKGGLHE